MFKESSEGIFKIHAENYKQELSDIYNYKDRCKDNYGAALFTAFRGKSSEGIDFVNEQCRCIILAGIPFLPPDNVRKQVYKNSNASYEVWYFTEAMRQVNQAIGRSFRHEHDYSSIILCDCRYLRDNLISSIPKWLSKTTICSNICECSTNLKNFYEKKK